jgi:hypothetical protein
LPTNPDRYVEHGFEKRLRMQKDTCLLDVAVEIVAVFERRGLVVNAPAG